MDPSHVHLFTHTKCPVSRLLSNLKSPQKNSSAFMKSESSQSRANTRQNAKNKTLKRVIEESVSLQIVSTRMQEKPSMARGVRVKCSEAHGLVNPESTSIQSSKPCKVLQYPSGKAQCGARSANQVMRSARLVRFDAPHFLSFRAFF